MDADELVLAGRGSRAGSKSRRKPMTDGSPTNPGSHGPRWEIQPTPLGTEPDVDPADPLGLGDLDAEAGASDSSEHTRYNQAQQDAQHQGHQQGPNHQDLQQRSEEHTSELQSLMRISYAVFCLKKKTQ